MERAQPSPFFMKYFAQGLAVLQKLVPPDTISSIDFCLAENIATENEKIESNIQFNSLLNQPSSYVVLQDPAPRNQDTIDHWKKLLTKYNSQDILSYINDIEEDPHYMKSLISLSEAAEQIGWDPFNRTTTTAHKSDSVILCGTGSGLLVNQILNYFNPTSLTVAVTSWEEFASSFMYANWVDIWNKFCLSHEHIISVICSQEPLALLDRITRVHSYKLDHAFVYTPKIVSESTELLSSYLKSDIIARSISYFGFTMDEYNMIWNSWTTLQKSPKVFHYPSPRPLKGDYIVIGSGPSLDEALPFIKKYEKNSIIISCASNYGTLRKYGIEVDVLCLLERGDFMIEEYTKNALLYGTGDTKLLASCTTPQHLHRLYSDSMVYFRPSLTPTSIFCNALYNVLPNEGPQTINTGVAFAISQYPSSITLIGVDLGSASPSEFRSKNAIGSSPRELSVEVKGNFTQIAYTNDLLLDAKRVLENVAISCQLDPSLNSVRLYNASNGVMINGWNPIRLAHDLEFQNNHILIKEQISQFWKQAPNYSIDIFRSSFIGAQPRKQLLGSILDMTEIAKSTNLSNFNESNKKLISLLSLSDKSYQSTTGLRIIRGNISRFLMGVNRQLIISAAAPDSEKELFIQKSMMVFLNILNELQTEIFALFDKLDSTLS